MRYFIIFLISFLVAIFQSSFLAHFPIFGWTMNLVLILAIWFVIFRNFKEGLFFAFFSGLFLDFFSARLFGLETLVLIFCVFFLNLFSGILKLPNLAKFLIFLPIFLAIYEILIKFLPWTILMGTK